MSDLNHQATRHLNAIAAELDKATRTLSTDAFTALVHELNERVTDLTWHVLQLNHSPALAMEKTWERPAACAVLDPTLDPLDCAP